MATIPSNPKTQFTKVRELVYELNVRDAMTENVIIAGPETLMSDLRDLLRANRISGVPVIEDGELLGIISIEDFINWLAGKEEDCPIRARMTARPVTVYSDEPLIHAISKLERRGFGRLPVLDRRSRRLVGMVTKGDVIERLLQKLEIDYHEDEIRRYRASHIFEDILGDEVSLTLLSRVKGSDFDRAGEASSAAKRTLERLGVHPQLVRRAAIACYEAEMNLVIYADGGNITVTVYSDKIRIDVDDTGPGIADVEKAMQPGYSTATDWVRELGFGAGMGLVNIKKCADEMELTSQVGRGTHLTIGIRIDSSQRLSKTG